MNLIEQAKIASLKPTWAPFRGWSLIFTPFAADADGNSLPAGLARIFDTAVQGEWLAKYLLCSLPADTYHVTVCDLINDSNVGVLPPDCAGTWLDALATPNLTPPEPLLRMIEDAGLNAVSLNDSSVELEFSRLFTAQGRMLGALLKPRKDTAAYRELIAARTALQNALFPLTGHAARPYSPHITLGYFANGQGGARAEHEIEPLQRRLETELSGATFRPTTVGLYSFCDMATYRLLPASPTPQRDDQPSA
jgi:hypothetical protein